MMESIIRDNIMTHMTKYNLFCDEQHGFVPGRSCMTQPLVTLDDWTELLDQGLPVDAIYLDFKKAFDTVPHERLLLKAESYGIQGDVLQWLRAFLVGRKQRVSVNGQVSGWSPVSSGIPQGSVLGPVMFVIYINDLPSSVKHALVRILADDTKMYKGIPSYAVHAEVQSDFSELENWSDRWQIGFNKGKCNVMHLGYNNPKHTYYMSDNNNTQVPLSETTAEKDLGVIVDNKLNLHEHVATATKKANSILGTIKKTFSCLDIVMIKKLFVSLVRPVLEYGNCVRSPRFKTDITNIEQVQRRATRLIPELRDKSYKDRLKQLKLPSLFHRQKRGDMIQTFKIIKGFDRIPADKIFKFSSSVTRGHNFKLQKQSCRLDVRKYFFANRVVNDWNSLPPNVVNAETINQFKDRLDSHWRHRMYDLPENYN